MRSVVKALPAAWETGAQASGFAAAVSINLGRLGIGSLDGFVWIGISKTDVGVPFDLAPGPFQKNVLFSRTLPDSTSPI